MLTYQNTYIYSQKKNFFITSTNVYFRWGPNSKNFLASNIPLFLSYAFPSSIVVVPSHRRKIPQQFMMPKLTKELLLLLCAMFIKVEFKETFCVSYTCNDFFGSLLTILFLLKGNISEK
jgi:hypothetical protein